LIRFSILFRFRNFKKHKNGISKKETVKKQTTKNKKKPNAKWAKPTTSQSVRRPVLSDQVGVQARPPLGGCCMPLKAV
jgi:hypothetical protein